MKRLSPVWFALTVCASFVACGRPATNEDCRYLIDRTVELKMKETKNDDEASVARKKTELRAELEPQMKECIGRRVSESMMTCLRNAQAVAELERCVR